MFRLSPPPLDPPALAAEMANPRAGALVAFEGWVRDHHDARAVSGLEYEAFGEMAVKVGTDIVREARQRFVILGALVVHRTGEASVGERAVWVGVTAEHRQEAFLAGRWIMDRIKQDVPIWKKESYVDGDDGAAAEWVHAGACCQSHQQDSEEDPATNPYYSRQVNLDQLGPAGQRALADAKVLVIGAGGLGCPALQYLAAAGVGTLHICDGDRIDLSNLHRQVLFDAHEIGQNKAVVAAERLRGRNPHIAVSAIGDAATRENLPQLVSDMDLVLDCTDSFEAKYWIHDACWEAGTILVQAAIYQFEGQLQVIDPAADAGCYRCLWPEAPPAHCVGNCAQVGVLGATAGLLGLYQAIEALKILLHWADDLRDATLLVDVLSGRTQRIQRSPRPDCPCRGTTPWPDADGALLFPGSGAREILRQATLVDLRDLPRERWTGLLDEVPARPIVLGCANGLRSRECLRQLGHPNGVYAWTRPIAEARQFL